MERESLLNYLDLNGVETKYLAGVFQILPSYFRVQYGFDDPLRMEWARSHLQYDPYLISSRIQKECPDGNYATAPQIREAFERRVEESTAEEIFTVSQSLAHRLSTDGPEGQEIYYWQMVKTYADIRRDFVKRAKAGEVLNTKILPHLQSNKGYLTTAFIRSILAEDDLKALNRAYIHIQSISTPNIEDFNKELQDKERKRNHLHKDLVAFAGEFLGKNDLQVIFDVLAEERLEKGYLRLDGNNLYYTAGITSIKSGPRMMEFMTSWPNAEVHFAEQIRKAYEYLEKIRSGVFGYGYLRYESSLGKERQETEDTAFFQALLEQYADYLQWEDGLISYFHGDYTFSRRIRIDLKRIKEEHADPAGFAEGIIDKIRNLVDKERGFFSDV